VTEPQQPDARPDGITIQVIDDGPYKVFGATTGRIVEIATDAGGDSRDYTTLETFTLRDGSELCRCGHSQTKPLCDNSHEKAGVDVRETAQHRQYRDDAEVNKGPEVTMFDKDLLCAHARFCDAGLGAWDEVSMSGEEHRAEAARIVRHCPGGRLTLIDNATGADLDGVEEQRIEVIEDPAIGAAGPIMLRGGVTVIAADGRAYEVRNRQALCRCGKSENKPFCDGSHDPR